MPQNSSSTGDVDYPALLCFAAHFLSLSALPVVLRVLLTSPSFSFSFPSVLCAVHAIAVSLCLWFWTLFSVFKPRAIRLSVIIPLSVVHSLISLVSFQNLFRNSLLHYQLLRLIPFLFLPTLSRTRTPTEQSLFQRVTSAAARPHFLFTITFICICYLHPPNHIPLFAVSVILSSFNHLSYPKHLRVITRATDLQLQLYTRSLSAAILCLVATPLETRFHLHNFEILATIANDLTDLEQPTAFYVYTSALLTFFTFVALRVSHAKLNPTAFRAASLLSALPPLCVHFFFTNGRPSSPSLNAMETYVIDGILISILLYCVHRISVSRIAQSMSRAQGFLENGQDEEEEEVRNVQSNNLTQNSFGTEALSN